MSDAGCPLYDAAGRRSSAATTGWCYRRPSDGTTRAASLMMRRDSLASVHNGKPPLLSHTNSSSSDYHAAVASAGPIHWENIFSLFAYDGLQQDRPTPSEATPSMVNPTTTTAAATAEDGSGVQKMVADDTARSAATATDLACLQRPKPSRTLSSIRSIRSIVTREPSRVDLTTSPEGR
ncbi:hypothetical protein PG993_007611 [Apiospora rasikravindrae]|uniref:Uncharacterized protein n=1 Tax=Apiospora rasikravindrae TaxID=990691 RepID=A0ABR1SZS9_9PEZI